MSVTVQRVNAASVMGYLESSPHLMLARQLCVFFRCLVLFRYYILVLFLCIALILFWVLFIIMIVFFFLYTLVLLLCLQITTTFYYLLKK